MEIQSNNVLPFKLQPVVQARQSTSRRPDIAPPLRVLIIDDTPEDRMAVRLALETQDFLLSEADNGERGLAAIAGIRPDCVVLDYHLPDMDGEEVLAALVIDGRAPCAIVMLTGSSNGAQAARMINMGALDYLNKDRIEPDSIRRAVTGAVERFRLMEAQRAAEARNAQLAAIVAASSDAIISVGIDNVILTWNAGATALFGYAGTEAVGRTVDELIVPEDLQAERASIYNAVRDGRQFLRVDTQRQRKDGVRVPVDLTVSPMSDGRGTVLGFSVVFHDITERLAIEKRLREREQELVQTQRIGQIGGFKLEKRDGDILAHRSPEYLSIHGLPLDTPVDTHADLVRRIHPEDRDQINATFLDALDNKSGFSLEYRIIRPSDGEVRWLSAIGEIERDAQGQWISVAGVHADITERQVAVEALRRREAELTQAQRVGKMGSFRAQVRGGEVTVTRSPEFLRIHGLSEGDIHETHESWKRRIHPDDLDRTVAAFWEAVETRTNYSSEYRIARADDGEMCWISNTIEFELDGLDGTVRMFGTHTDITERKEAEEALRLSTALYRGVFDNAATGIAVSNMKGEVTHANPAFRTLLGYTQDELKRIPFGHLIHPDDRSANIVEIEKILNGEQPSFEIENRYVAKNGTDVHVRKYVSIVPGAGGAPQYMFSLATDITERKRAEERIRLAQVAGEIGLFERDFVAKVTRWSPEMARLYGYDSVDFGTELDIDFAFERHFHPEDKASYAAVRKAFDKSTDTQFNFEFRIIRKDGQVRWILSRGELQRNANGKPLLATGINMDITERKRVEDALAASEAYNRRLMEASPDCVKVIDLEGRVQQMNFNGQCLMEIEDFGAVCGQRWHNLWPEESREHIAAAMRDALSGGTGRFVGFCPTAKGTPKWWDVAVNTVPGADGMPVALLAASRDITESRRSQEQIELLVREVTHRSKNLLGVVQAIARQTVAHSTLETFGKSFSERINALSASHDLLVQSNWTGVDLAELVRSQLVAFRGDIDHVSLNGPKVRISSAAAQTLGMAIHELATNAVKYGALHHADGRVEIVWDLNGVGADRTFKMMWRERDGPPVVPPTRQGFGTTVVNHLVRASLDADVTLEYEPTGVVWRIECGGARLLDA